MANYTTQHSMLLVADFIAAHPGVKRNQIMSEMSMKASESTVYRWLELAVKNGLIQRVGATSSACYMPTDKLRAEHIRRHLAQPVERRGRVGYNKDWLAEYKPNKTFLLSKSDLSRLSARCPIGAAPVSKMSSGDVAMFVSELSYASSHLEGNKYELADTVRLTDHLMEKEGMSPRDSKMILNHRDATKLVFQTIAEEGRMEISPFSLRCLHTQLIHGLIKQDDLGKLRTSHTEISGSCYIPPDVPAVVSQQYESLIKKAVKIKNPFEQSFFLLVHLPYLQPFEDGNKRVSRVACNIPLLNAGVTPISWMGASILEREYKDGVIATYELNDHLLMRQVFMENFMRSVERFELMRRQRDPNPISTKYHDQAKTYVREFIETGSDMIPARVEAEDVPEFVAYVNGEIEAIKSNPLVGVRYGFNPNKIRLWMEHLEHQSFEDSLKAQESRPRNR